jgi:hypothetical protein
MINQPPYQWTLKLAVSLSEDYNRRVFCDEHEALQAYYSIGDAIALAASLWASRDREAHASVRYILNRLYSYLDGEPSSPVHRQHEDLRESIERMVSKCKLPRKTGEQGEQNAARPLLDIAHRNHILVDFICKHVNAVVLDGKLLPESVHKNDLDAVVSIIKAHGESRI